MDGATRPKSLQFKGLFHGHWVNWQQKGEAFSIFIQQAMASAGSYPPHYRRLTTPAPHHTISCGPNDPTNGVNHRTQDKVISKTAKIDLAYFLDTKSQCALDKVVPEIMILLKM